MSWTLKLQRDKDSQLSTFTIPEDDVIFYAVLKRDKIEHFKYNGGNYRTRVRVLHLGEEYENENSVVKEGKGHIVFYMTLLESSTIEHYYPNFERDGLMGRWKLSTPSSLNLNSEKNNQRSEIEPVLSLVQAFDEKNAKEFINCAQSRKNPEFIRNSYLEVS
jgi:hypothetical protein